MPLLKRSFSTSSRRHTLILLIVLGILWIQSPQTDRSVEQVNAAGTPGTLFLPIIRSGPSLHAFYGVETAPSRLTRAKIVNHSQHLGAQWVRLNGVKWSAIQPNQGGAYNWSALAAFEGQLSTALAIGQIPVVVIRDSPTWATGRNSTCAAIKTEHFGDFAAFIKALLTRFQERGFNVNYWEFGNEPDVDPRLVSSISEYGCWGDIDDREYYGGQHYGEMLKIVQPVIKSVNPNAKVVTGGLLLGIPNTTLEWYGKPERFFEGILKSGAAPFFDIVAYHEYIVYTGQADNLIEGTIEWKDYGGMSKGKPTYLRQIMARYNVSKALILNETALLCDNTPPSATQVAGLCYAQTADFIASFQDVQADMVAPLLVRALGEGVESVMWYTLGGSDWRYSDLLSAQSNPRPAYQAYKTLIAQTGSALQYPTSVNTYGASVEAYRFIHRSDVVDVVWSPTRTLQSIRIPEKNFSAAYDRDGKQIVPERNHGFVVLQVGGGAVYIHRAP